ncbi:nucleic acid-binding protein [Pseudovirgaria hyperparasitica]|uniref:Nucleic acid-binding protein n=1 Tax=Pseudovirgaria hyperparasitica TaxID=470096 RepID=A0A6A6VV38_9PEZI|nr:nucleic acid-binding protein [Pseudovirgaria hyperparasitica]KAF2753739.1 nucleic acid-binding protein [Pseudovirgaria hyperparasitica]
MPPPILHRNFNGVVVSAGKMDRTVKVRIATQTWNKRVKKHFPDAKHHLVHDPANSVREGDVVSIQSGWRKAQHVRHVVTKILSPFGSPLEDRPRLPTLEEYRVAREKLRLEKDVRQATRGRGASVKRVAIAQVTGMFDKLGVQETDELRNTLRKKMKRMNKKQKEKIRAIGQDGEILLRENQVDRLVANLETPRSEDKVHA